MIRSKMSNVFLVFASKLLTAGIYSNWEWTARAYSTNLVCKKRGFWSPGGPPKSGGGCWTAPRSDFELSEYGGGGSSLIFLQMISDCESNQYNALNYDDKTKDVFLPQKHIRLEGWWNDTTLWSSPVCGYAIFESCMWTVECLLNAMHITLRNLNEIHAICWFEVYAFLQVMYIRSGMEAGSLCQSL